MPTVNEILKATGLDDEAIAALDPKLVAGFTTVVSSAQQTLDQAELAKRAQAQQYDEQIAPALDGWANEKASMATKIAAYEAALKGAKEGGFNVPEILNPPAARTADGKFVAGQNDVPGSPKFVEGIRKELGGAFAFMADTQWRYRSLFGKEMPDSPTSIIAEATAQRLDPSVYAAKKYDFAGKESAIKAEEQKKHDDGIRAEAKAEADRAWAEKVGNNPNIRAAQSSAYSTIDKAIKSGERKDPTMMTREQRHASTRQAIMKEVAENTTVQ